MRRKLENTFASLENYNCFACGPNHPFGLRLAFEYDEEQETAISEFVPDTMFAGFPGILHGGIQATILDEVAFWGTWAKHQRTGFTYDLSVKYKKKCPVSELIIARGRIGEINKRLVEVEVTLSNPEGDVIYTEGIVHYYIPRVEPRARA